MMIGILDLNEPHKLPMKLFFFCFMQRRIKRTEIRQENEAKSKEIENETKQNRKTEESLKLIYTFVLRHHCAHQKFTLSYIKTTRMLAYFILLFRLLLPIAILAIHIFVAHVSLSTAAKTENYQILERAGCIWYVV